MTRLFRYLARYRARYVGGAFCLLATASFAMAIPYLLKIAVDSVADANLHRTGQFALLITVIALFQGLARTASRALIFNVGRDVETDLRNDLFAHLLRLSSSYYQTQQTGDLMSRLINDVTAVRVLLGPGILNLVNTPIYYIYAVSIMLTLNPMLTGVALLPFPFLILLVKRVTRRMMEETLQVQRGLSELSSHVQEKVSGISVVKAYAIEEVTRRQFLDLNSDFTARSVSLARTRGRLVPLMKISAGAGALTTLVFGGNQVAQGQLSLGDLVAFLAYLNLLAWPTMALGWMLSILQRGRAAMQRLEQIFAVEPEIEDRAGVRPLPAIRGDIEFRNVSFAYEHNGDSRMVLDGVSLHIAPGEKLALVGRTGAGKSSLVQLLPRLFDPTGGTILLDGVDLRDFPLHQLRSAIGFVPQDPFLFSRTIRENVEFALEDSQSASVDRATEAAGVRDDIVAFPRGLETLVGERGVTLSGGQKQRLTMARAIATSPPIIVLDDALSSVDTRTEKKILDHLREIMRGRTSIVVAHRISTVIDADQIAVMDEGRIVELGTHASLLARNQLYAELFRQQKLEQELESL